jgi:hypothetical protein
LPIAKTRAWTDISLPFRLQVCLTIFWNNYGSNSLAFYWNFSPKVTSWFLERHFENSTCHNLFKLQGSLKEYSSFEYEYFISYWTFYMRFKFIHSIL